MASTYVPPFNLWLKRRRKELDLTQWELAERVGCSEIAIVKLEAGGRRPSRQIAELLADTFVIPLDERAAFIRYARREPHPGPSTAPAPSTAFVLRAGSGLPSPTEDEGVDRTPWRALHLGQTNLPSVLTPLVGRELQEEALHRLMLQKEVRLVTLAGPPGIGKTRLSIEVASNLLEQFADGVFFVGLAPIREPDGVVPSIAAALKVREAGGQSPRQSLLEYVRGKKMLLVLDNFEQVLDAGTDVLALLEGCPWLKVLVTSREALHVPGEQQFPVPSLQLADPASLPPIQTLQTIPAVRLFVERAQVVNPQFALNEHNSRAVAAICARLHGLPLAIELAAARVNLLSPQEMQPRLVNSLSLLASQAHYLPPRQRTLRGAIDWSYQLLSHAEQKLFARLSVFMGGFTLPAAEAVCNAQSDLPGEVLDGIESLLDKNLLKREEDLGESRYTMLEMIREYASERLAKEEIDRHIDLASQPQDKATGASGPVAEIRRQHAEYFLALAQGAEMELRGSRQQVDWLHRLEEEHDNLRAALRWALERNEIELALGMAGALWKFWELRGYMTEGRRWLAAALSTSNPSSTESDPGAIWATRTAARAKALFAAGRLAERQGDNATAQPLLEESLTLARRIDDKQLIALALHNLANVATYQGDYAAARTLAEESLAIRTAIGDRWGMANILHNLGFQAEGMGDHVASSGFYEQSLAISRELEDKWGAAYSLDGLSYQALQRGDYLLANSLLKEGMALRQELGEKSGIARSLERLARVAGRRGQTLRAARLYGAADALRENEDIPIMPVDHFEYEQAVAQAHNQLNDREAEWQKAWQAGRTMAMGEAIAYALEEKLDSQPQA